MDAIRHLIQALYQTFGSTGHMRTVEQALERLDLQPHEREAFDWLARTIRQSGHDLQRAKNDVRRGGLF